MKPSNLVSSDFLEPAAICIKPAPPPTAENQAVTVNLTDCLACSGCITSAETVLVNQQSWTKVQEAMDNIRPLVYTVSPQSRVAIAYELGIELEEATRRILNYLINSYHNVVDILDSNDGRTYSLLATAEDFVQNHQNSKLVDGITTTMTLLPRLVSVCPGWICFVEKTHPELIPQVCLARSPQQIMGVIARLKHPDCFHVAIMPCYDKKLEASRTQDFSLNEGIPDVNCVLTTQELLRQMKDYVIPDSPYTIKGTQYNMSHEGSGAGGYLEFTMYYAIRKLFPDIYANQSSRIVERRKRADNIDYVEYDVVASGDERLGDERVLLRFARVWGMRNIQTWLRNAKGKNQQQYDFVEVMACPGGCLNGGGQFSSSITNSLSLSQQRERLQLLNEIYNSLPKMPNTFFEHQVEDSMLTILRERGLLWTSYRPVSMDQFRPFQLHW